MESFNYLSVLISIILGLAIAQVLQGVRGLVLTRSKVKLYTPTIVWTGMALLIAIQGWWASFSMHQQANWNFLGLLTIVLQATSVYMVAALVLPDAKGDNAADLREHYFAHRHWFFGALLGSVVFSLLKELVLYGRLPHPLDLGFQLAFGVLSITAMLVRRGVVSQTRSSHCGRALSVLYRLDFLQAAPMIHGSPYRKSTGR